MNRMGAGLNPFDPQPPDWAQGAGATRSCARSLPLSPGPVGGGPPVGGGGRQATTPPVLRFSDQYIVGVLDLRAVEFPHLLEFVRCRFEEPPDLRQAKLAGCEFDSCWLPGLRGAEPLQRQRPPARRGDPGGGPGRPHRRRDQRLVGAHRARLVNVGGYALHADRLQLAGALLAAQPRGATGRCASPACVPGATSTSPARCWTARTGTRWTGTGCTSAATCSVSPPASGRSSPSGGCTCPAPGSTATSRCAVRCCSPPTRTTTTAATSGSSTRVPR